MYSHNINQILETQLRQTKTRFLGVFPSDHIPNHLDSFPCCFVANTDPHNEPGTHWVAFFYPSLDSLEFFDSYGMPPSFYGFRSPCNVEYNQYQFQSFSTKVCGEYCIYFLYHRARNHSLSYICHKLKQYHHSVDHYVGSFVSHFRLPKLKCSQFNSQYAKIKGRK